MFLNLSILEPKNQDLGNTILKRRFPGGRSRSPGVGGADMKTITPWVGISSLRSGRYPVVIYDYRRSIGPFDLSLEIRLSQPLESIGEIIDTGSTCYIQDASFLIYMLNGQM